MKLYAQLSKVSFLRNHYVSKFLFVAFVGIHIPLIGLAVFLVYFDNLLAPINVFFISLILTLVATGVTLIFLNNLIAPILQGSKALTDYRNNLIVPRLPLNYTDEAGVMLSNIQATIQSNQKLVNERQMLFKVLTDYLRDQIIETDGVVKQINKESNTTVLKNLTENASKSMLQQLHFVDHFTDLLKEDERINTEQVKIRSVNFQVLWNEVMLEAKSASDAKNVKINSNIAISDVRVKVNMKMLHQSFLYLLDTSIKYASQGSEIELKSEKLPGFIMLHLKVHGIGFEPGQAMKMFTDFSTITEDNVLYSPGIQLYLARQIMERFGGKVIAQSSGLNNGTIFTIELKTYR